MLGHRQGCRVILKDLDLSDDRERGFVMVSFARRTGSHASYLRDLMRCGARVLVARAPTALREDGKPIMYGWAASLRDQLIHCYVVHDYRTFPVLPRLCDALGLDLSKPTVLLFNSLGVEKAAEQFGWNLIAPSETGPEKGAA